MLSLKCSSNCMATIDGVDKGCPRTLSRVNGNSVHSGISGTTITSTTSRTSCAIRWAWFTGTSLPRRTMWRGRHVASELFHLAEQVEFLFSLPRCPESQATPSRWFFADISCGMPVVALRQLAEWSTSQNRLYTYVSLQNGSGLRTVYTYVSL